jgi:hypothetical protein
MYNPDDNTFMLIDFGLSVSGLSENPATRDKIIHRQLKSFYFVDIIAFLNSVFLRFCYISCSNILIFNNFKQDIIEIEKLVFHLQDISNVRSSNYGKSASDLLTPLRSFVENLDKPLDYSLTETFNNFPIEKIKDSVAEQRLRARITGNEISEKNMMMMNSANAGGRKTKKRFKRV